MVFRTAPCASSSGLARRRIACSWWWRRNPDRAAVFGAITVEGNVSVGEDVIRRELTFHEGEEYRLSEITESQRGCTSCELFQFANITPRLPEDRSPRSPRGCHGGRRKTSPAAAGARLRLRGESARRVNWRHVNFTGGARTMDTEAKWSSLEQGFRGTFTSRFCSGPACRLMLRERHGGRRSRVQIPQQRRPRDARQAVRPWARTGFERGVRNQMRISFINEYENYAITRGALNDPTLRDELIALGLDPVTGKGNGTALCGGVRFRPGYVRATAGSRGRGT